MEERKIYIRFECINMATVACGSDTDPYYVLESAQKYYDWIVESDKKVDLRVVSNDTDGAA